jgi:branched-chain amino acid transport system permease protein
MMSWSIWIAQGLSGLAQASSLFLVAAGLSIIFGVTRIVNFAHGSLYMLGAYIGVTLVERWSGAMGFWAAIAVAALAVGMLGAAMEILLLRRLYKSPELLQLLATFGVVLVVQDLALKIWGPEEILGPRAPGLGGRVVILGQAIPQYELFLIAVGPVVLALLWLLFNRTRWGVLVRAATQDREMTGALGVNERMLFTTVFFLGSALAGLGGALQVPREAVNLHMDISIVVETFVVVVIGGMGSIAGAAAASVLIGLLHAFGILVFPQITLVLVFLVMAVVLIVRPHGLLGRETGTQRGEAHAAEAPLAQPAPETLRTALLVVGAVALLPLLAGDYARVVAAELMVLALFAASLHLLMGPGGLVSFGHAAYFGLGAYAAALLSRHFGTGMELGLVAAPIAAGLGALLFGWFCVRLSGVYLAMLSLAAAQIVWSVAFQWVGVTGGDNGILNVWPSAWARPRAVYYVLSLLIAGAAILMLRRVVYSPFGMALRAGRDAALRAEAVGIDVRRIQWLAFALAGAFAGLAGGLAAYLRGSVFPTILAIPQSVDGLVMVLLGGIASLEGPLVGAALFHLLRTQLLSHTDLWRLVLGLAIIGLVVLFPHGVMGTLSRWREARAVAQAKGAP